MTSTNDLPMRVSMPQRILVTWFEPFGARTFNASEDAAKGALTRTRSNVDVVGLLLPVVYGECWSVLCRALNAQSFDAVIAFGEGSPQVKVETVGYNVFDTQGPNNRDNLGNPPPAEKIVANGPHAVMSPFPSTAIVQSLKADGIPSEVGVEAGTFICNEVLYQLSNAPHLVAMTGFVHVPAVQEGDIAARDLVYQTGRIVLDNLVDFLTTTTR